MPKTKKRGKHYVTNKEMMEELRLYGETEIISEKLHLMFFKMASQIGTKPRFSGYTWIEDMISDAYLKCCSIVHKFDAEKYDNPFGYFTTVIIHFFWDALAGETKQKNIKDRLRDDQVSQIYHRYGITFKVGNKHEASS